MIAVHPASGARVGRATEMAVLFDQPIDLATAAPLIELDGPKGVPISTRLAHPLGPTFQGIKVDPRYVVLVRPTSPLPAGQDINLVAADHTRSSAQRPPHVNGFTVVDPLAFRDVTCGWGDDRCSFAKGCSTPRTDGARALQQPHRGVEQGAGARVRVTPAVKNLSIRSEGWDEGRIVIGGELVSSTTYDVAIEGLVDRFGQRLGAPVRFQIETAPQSASAAMPEG